VTLEQAAARAFVLKLGRGLHAAGYSAHRLEEAVMLVAQRLGLEAHLFSTPTALFAAFGPEGHQRTHLLRVEPGSTDLSRLAALDGVATRVALGQESPERGSQELDAILAAPPRYGPALTVAAFALASAAASRFFGGGPREALASLVIGCAIGLLALLAGRVRALTRVFEASAATLAAFLATFAAVHFGPVAAFTAMLSGLIVLVPGFALTTAVIELAQRHLMAGTARLTGAIGTLLAMGFGVALGGRLAEVLFGPAPLAPPVAVAGWTEWLALVVAPLGFVVLLKADWGDAPAIVLGSALAYFGTRLGSQLLGPELGAFLGALLVGAWGNAYARWRHRPAVIVISPGILLLVPGSIGFRSVTSLLDRNTVLGIEAAFTMAFVAVCLATGLLFGNVLVPPRSLLAEEAATHKE
jgi:uncharacterized membrane protein YjjP (DUF1212 family)